MVIWTEVPVKIYHKCWHVHKLYGKLHRDFCVVYGEVPLGRFNEITGKFEDCVNTRGYAYGARNRAKYRSKK